MKKFLKIFPIVLACAGTLFIIARVTNALQFYHAASGSMSPSIEPGNYFFSTNLVNPARYDIIVFKRRTDEFDGVDEPGKMARFTYRLIAMGGEKLQIKGGIAYVNDRLADDSTKLKFLYSFAKNRREDIVKALQLDESNLTQDEIYSQEYSCVMTMTFPQYKAAEKITPLAKFFYSDYTDTTLYKNDAKKNWNTNDYGPLIIPPHHYFVLGDNRNGARDSRFISPVNEKDVTGVIIGKK